MTVEELGIDAINQFLTNIGDTTPVLVSLIITESCTITTRMGQLTSEKDWRLLLSATQSASVNNQIWGEAYVFCNFFHQCRQGVV
jgi:hypothetical protein